MAKGGKICSHEWVRSRLAWAGTGLWLLLPQTGWPKDQREHVRKSPFFHTERCNTSSFWAGVSFQSPSCRIYTYLCVSVCPSVRMAFVRGPEDALALRFQFFAHQKAPSNSFPSHCFHFPAAFRPRRPTTRHWKAFQQNVYSCKKTSRKPCIFM